MFVEDLYNYVLQMLSASHESCNRIQLYQKPSKRFIIGSLADSSKDYAVAEGIGENKVQAKSALRHNSMAVIFLLEKNNSSSIKVKPSCSIFYRVLPTFEEQLDFCETIKDDMSMKKDPGFQKVYVQTSCDFKEFEFSLTSNKESELLDFGDVRTQILAENDAYRTNSEIKSKLAEKNIRNKFDPEWILKEDVYNEIIDKLKKSPSKKTFEWEGQIIVEMEDYNSELNLITIWFKNITEGRNFEKFFFNCQLTIELNQNKLIPFEYKYKYEDFNYEQEGFLRTLNCHANFLVDTNEIITKPYALFNQRRKAPRISIKGIVPKFSELQKSTDILKKLLNALKEQYSNYTNHPTYKDDSHQHYLQFKKETENFYFLIQRFEEGLSLLESDSNIRRSFFLMNNVFEDVAKGQYEGWRLFQIVFIVMIIPDIINLKKNRHIADIIHVDTGGGKSEVYFGAVIFLLFWDRLRGKNKGVSAITKFPLRMLSIQQLQRIAKVVVFAEELRKSEGIGGDPFSVGYYVGVSEEFPRYTYPVIEKIKAAKEKGENIPGMLLDQCPLCSGNIILDIEDSEGKVVHTCKECNKNYYIYFTNAEVYRLLPSFIVSTVDKLASVSLNRRFKNLLGGKLSLCSENHKYIPINDKCEVKIGHNRSCKGTPISCDEKIEGPTLMIQDEMHLLREGFGTINSHFESLLNTLLLKLSGKQFKYISMTATVSGAKEQIDHLYGKDYFIFPGNVPRGFNEDEDFFFEYKKEMDGTPTTQRILIGLKPNLRDNQYASLLTIFHITKFLENVSSNLKTYSTHYKISEKELEDELRKYQCLLTYHGKKADVFGMNYFIHTVVTSKLKNFNVSKIPLTGDNNLDEIKKAILEIQEFPNVKENFNKIHATFATSVVSHGVDINNWNIMIFQGMTRNTSEYIQSLSRVGRRHLGVIFLWFYPNRVRDLSYYKNFQFFHNILQHKVEKTPISRWTKLGFKQTFTSIFCASILNYISNEIEAPLYTVDAVNSHFDDIANREKLFEFLKEAYYAEMDRVGAEWFKDNLRGQTEERLNHLKRYTASVHKNFFPNALKDSKNPYFKTQYGMRGIQEQIVLRLNEDFIGFVDKYQRGGKD